MAYAVKFNTSTIDEHDDATEAWDNVLDMLEADMDNVPEGDMDALASIAEAIKFVVNRDQTTPGVVGFIDPDSAGRFSVYGVIRTEQP